MTMASAAAPHSVPSICRRVGTRLRGHKGAKVGAPLPKVRQQQAANLAESEWEEF